MKAILVLVTALLLTACSSSTLQPPKYYVLTGQPLALSEPSELVNTPAIKVQSVILAEYLKSSNMVLQVSEHELFFSTNNLWAEPLQVGIEKTLNNYLPIPSQSTTEVLSLSVEIDYFHTIDQNSVILAGRYWLENSAGEKVIVAPFSLSEALKGSGYNYAVARMSDLLKLLAEDVRQKAASLTPDVTQ